MSGNRTKKNGKKNKFSNTPELLQVKSVKLDRPSSSKDSKSNAKSEGNLRKEQKVNILKNQHLENELMDDGITELETCLVNKFRTFSLGSEGESIPSTSFLKSIGGSDANSIQGTIDEEIPLVMQYCPEQNGETSEKVEDYANSYKYYNAKSSKSIKFTNQVTVLYFNGEDILGESSEPLKKEQDQQLRNKEMRKEHLMSKGQIDNVYLF